MSSHSHDEALTQTITLDELIEALKSVRLWVRHDDNERQAHQMKVLHATDAARDIAISVMVRRASS